MKILELSKSYIRKHYNNNYDNAINALDGVLFDDERVKHAFNFGNGTVKNFIGYIKNNRQFCKYYDLENNQYI